MQKKSRLKFNIEFLSEQLYAHTNRFCVVQENIKLEVLKVHTELARFVH